jgi:HD-like signal output (HDOD) protein
MDRGNLKEIVLRAAGRMPMLPVVAQRTLALLAKDDVSVAELSNVVEQDVVIAGYLLSIANSALYSRGRAVSSLRQAIARIGIRKTRNAILALSISLPLRRVRLPQSWSSARFNAHSLASAILADLLVQRTPGENAEWAFVAGLLHDVGLLLIATAVPGQAVLMCDATSDYQIAEWERASLGFNHFEVGAELLARWDCPGIVQEASMFCQNNAFEYRSPLSLGMVVKTASLLADADGTSVFGSTQDSTFVQQLLEALKLPAPSKLLELFRAEYNGLQACLVGGQTAVTQ